MMDKIEKTITEKSDKIMANEKIERFVNNVGGMLCFIGAVVFGIMFIVGGVSLMKTGKNYVVKPSKEEEASAESTEAAATEEAASAESTEPATTEEAKPAEPSAE